MISGLESDPLATGSRAAESPAPTPSPTTPSEKPTDPLTGGKVSNQG